MKNRTIVLLGYKSQSHTNYWPWLRFDHVFRTLGHETVWCDMEHIPRSPHKDRLFVCWNSPACDVLIDRGHVRKNDIVLQKLTSLGAGDEHVNWGSDPLAFFKTWKWNTYRRIEKYHDAGVNIHAFGCKTDYVSFPEKHRIVRKLGENVHWITWGPCCMDYSELQSSAPITSGFVHSISYCGMKWGGAGRGNTDQWGRIMEPIVKHFEDRKLSIALAGQGNPMGRISNEQHKDILKIGKVCPIVHCPSWIAERGIMDRWFTVFGLGRFGVCDNPGLYDLMDEDEVVVETDPGEYVAKTIYFHDNPDKQLPYILKAQQRIKKEYNFYDQWKKVLAEIE